MSDPIVDVMATRVLAYIEGDGGRSTLEAALSVWHDAKWPGKDDDRLITNKLAEEAGEVSGAATKVAEGRRTLQDLADEIGDVLIVLSVLAGRHDWTLDQLRADRARQVLSR